MDYNTEMLRLYFDEKNYSEERIKYMLEHNPYDSYFSYWESETKRNNKIFADCIRRNGLIKRDIQVQEIGVHEKNGVSKYITDNIFFTPVSIKDSISSIRLSGRFVLFKGIYKDELTLLSRLEKNSIPYITGICTHDTKYFIKILYLYQEYLKELSNSKMVHLELADKKVLLLKSK